MKIEEKPSLIKGCLTAVTHGFGIIALIAIIIILLTLGNVNVNMNVRVYLVQHKTKNEVRKL